mgnify:CR=1 FL=1
MVEKNIPEYIRSYQETSSSEIDKTSTNLSKRRTKENHNNIVYLPK